MGDYLRWDNGTAFRDNEGWFVYLYTCAACASLVKEDNLDTHEAYHEKKGDYPE